MVSKNVNYKAESTDHERGYLCFEGPAKSTLFFLFFPLPDICKHLSCPLDAALDREKLKLFQNILLSMQCKHLFSTMLSSLLGMLHPEGDQPGFKAN
jgi:hypothetical protein